MRARCGLEGRAPDSRGLRIPRPSSALICGTNDAQSNRPRWSRNQTDRAHSGRGSSSPAETPSVLPKRVCMRARCGLEGRAPDSRRLRIARVLCVDLHCYLGFFVAGADFLVLVLEFPIFDYENEDDDEADFSCGLRRQIRLHFQVNARFLHACLIASIKL
jgi:hypothetical protein